MHATEFGCLAFCPYLNPKRLFSRTVNPLAYCRFLLYDSGMYTALPCITHQYFCANYAFICILWRCWAYVFMQVFAIYFLLACSPYCISQVSVLQICNHILTHFAKPFTVVLKQVSFNCWKFQSYFIILGVTEMGLGPKTVHIKGSLLCL